MMWPVGGHVSILTFIAKSGINSPTPGGTEGFADVGGYPTKNFDSSVRVTACAASDYATDDYAGKGKTLYRHMYGSFEIVRLLRRISPRISDARKVEAKKKKFL